ncbi:MAG: vitamin K epoxide reductase family protein [Candidatus Saccharibacteria bacterium]|nr:vitamin K epoxide reductase family protein [Candidatus Saccharibacteria bacterium]
MNKVKKMTLNQSIGYILAICGIIGFFAAFILTVEKIELIKNPSYVPSCSISPLLSCGSVMKTPEASVFGFANSLIGVMGFSVVATIGMAIIAGAKFKRWFWLGLQVGTIFGIGFVHWLIYQSVFDIGKLCPYCIIVWSVMIPIFVYTTLYNLIFGNIKVPAKLKSVNDFLQRHHGDIVIVWYLIITGIILNHFWFYWKTLF